VGKPVLTIRPERVQIIDRQSRDQWIITTARATLARLKMMQEALKGTCTDGRILQACSHYSLTRKDLCELAELVAGALANIRPAQETGPVVQVKPRDMIMEYIRTNSGPRGVAIDEILEMVRLQGISQEAALAAVGTLIVEDECYQPQKGFVKPL
jgi:hypothetical protein